MAPKSLLWWLAGFVFCALAVAGWRPFKSAFEARMDRIPAPGSPPADGLQLADAPIESTDIASTPIESTPYAATPIASTPISSTPISSTPVSAGPAPREVPHEGGPT